MAVLEYVPKSASINRVVNTLIEENGFGPPGTAQEFQRESGFRYAPLSEMWGGPCGQERIVPGQKPVPLQRLGVLFGASPDKLTRGTTSTVKAWEAFPECLLCNDSLSGKSGVSPSTAHSWRMKLFSQVDNPVEGRIPKGVMPEDGLCLPSNFKGNWKGMANPGIKKDYSDVLPGITAGTDSGIIPSFIL